MFKLVLLECFTQRFGEKVEKPPKLHLNFTVDFVKKIILKPIPLDAESKTLYRIYIMLIQLTKQFAAHSEIQFF